MLDDLNQQEVVQEEAPEVQAAPEGQMALPAKDTETNMARMRESMKRIERERDEAQRKAQELEQRYATTQKEDIYSIAPDELVEGKHLTRYERKMKELEEKVSRYEQQTNLNSAETRLKSQYSDFDAVVNEDNINALRDAYPELAASINANGDLYSKAASAYTVIKKLGIYKEDVYKNEREHAQTNSTKPRPLASVSPQQGDSPLARANAFANGLTPELKAQLRKEMEEVRRRN